MELTSNIDTEWSKISFKKFAPLHIGNMKLNIVLSILFTLVINASIWQLYFATNEINQFSDIFQCISFFLFINFILLALFTLINFPWIHKLFLITFLMTSVPAMYFAVCHGVQYDSSMLQNIFETDTKEAIELLTVSYWQVFILLAIFPSILIFRANINYHKFWKQLSLNCAYLVLFIICAFASIYPYYGELSSFVRNNNHQLSNSLLPTALLRATYKNMLATNNETTIIKEILDPKAHSNYLMHIAKRKPLALVVIIGETAREKSFSFQHSGMSHLNEPLINRDNLIYFSNFWSCGTNTALSVPCMFSMYSKNDYKRSMNMQYENVAEIINRVGYDVTWRNNNSGCKGICEHLNKDPINKENSEKFYHDGEFYDEALVEDLARRIKAHQTNQVIFLHQLGSHGPAYYKRVPEEDKILQPACESAEFADCNQNEIINAYNNTVLYTKKTIGMAIDTLESLQDDYDTVLIYISDHGESTGENGIYLHGVPYFLAPDEQIHIPALIWVSDSLATSQGIDMKCMQDKSKDRFSHDNFSHTLLGILKIESTVYSKPMDLFDNCRTEDITATNRRLVVN